MKRMAAFPGASIRRLFFFLLLLTIITIPFTTIAKVIKVEITSREVISDCPELIHTGSYEVIKGIIYLEVNPENLANQQIVDLHLAPRNRCGCVEFSTEFELHKPLNPDRGNHRLIYFVNNRGNKLGSGFFSNSAGHNWLYTNGWSYLWCGWNCDVIEDARKLNISVPVIKEKGKAVTGKVYCEIYSYADDPVPSMPLVWGGSIPYPPVSLNSAKDRLAVRQYPWEKPLPIPRDKWAFARWEDGRAVADPGFIYIKDLFKPGWLYELVYTGKDPKVTGLGMAAIRDLVSFFRYEKADRDGLPNPLADVIDYTFAWGHSQSGRLLNHFVYDNFNGDEAKRIVFDGIIPNCPGGGKGQFNSRFAQMTRHGSHLEDNRYPVDFFPFTSVEQFDPVKGERGDNLARARKSNLLPKIMYVNSSTDYWTRGASLLHTDVEGKKDMEIDPNVRIYAIAGLAHTTGRTGIITRALLTALDQWITLNIDPPESCIPKISDGTLVDLKTWKGVFPDIPGCRIPDSYYHPYRFDQGPRWKKSGIADNVPPKTGPRYVCLVPQVDEDGNEIAGIRMPEIEVPLATYNGWSMRSPTFSNTLRRNAGRIWPFAVTSDERKKNNDPRKSVLERYPTKKDYLYAVMKSLLILQKKRLLLDQDMDFLLKEAAEQNYWYASGEENLVSIKSLTAQPTVVNRGETVELTVVTEGYMEDIYILRFIWRESPRVRIQFDGKQKAVNVKCYLMEIGEGFPRGTFHFDIQAIDRNFNPVYLIGTEKAGKGEVASVAITVK